MILLLLNYSFFFSFFLFYKFQNMKIILRSSRALFTFVNTPISEILTTTGLEPSSKYPKSREKPHQPSHLKSRVQLFWRTRPARSERETRCPMNSAPFVMRGEAPRTPRKAPHKDRNLYELLLPPWITIAGDVIPLKAI